MSLLNWICGYWAICLYRIIYTKRPLILLWRFFSPCKTIRKCSVTLVFRLTIWQWHSHVIKKRNQFAYNVFLGYSNPALLLQYVNFNSRLTGAGHSTLHFESRSQIPSVPAIIPFEGITVIHLVIKIFVGPFTPTVKPNIKPIAVQVVVKWNGKHDSKCFGDLRQVVCKYSYHACCNRPPSFLCCVKQGFT